MRRKTGLGEDPNGYEEIIGSLSIKPGIYAIGIKKFEKIGLFLDNLLTNLEIKLNKFGSSHYFYYGSDLTNIDCLNTGYSDVLFVQLPEYVEEPILNGRLVGAYGGADFIVHNLRAYALRESLCILFMYHEDQLFNPHYMQSFAALCIRRVLLMSESHYHFWPEESLVGRLDDAQKAEAGQGGHIYLEYTGEISGEFRGPLYYEFDLEDGALTPASEASPCK